MHHVNLSYIMYSSYVLFVVVAQPDAEAQHGLPSMYDTHFNPYYNFGQMQLDASMLGDSDFSAESRLMHHLLRKYSAVGSYARPVRNSSQPVYVGFSMTLVQILDFDETRQLIVSNVWKSYHWQDELLTWNPDDYGGIRDIRMPPSFVWTPDIVLYNNADDEFDHEVHKELLAVMSDGVVKWIPSAIYKSSCRVDMTNFPFDTQTCYFKFGSWTYDGHKLDFNFLNDSHKDIDMMEYVASSEWQVLGTGARLHIRFYPCCGDAPYPEIIYHVTIKRRTAFYVVVLILPCLLLSILTLVMFWYPPHRPDRTGLGMSLFSSFFVLLLILVQASPPTSHSISLLGVYYCINMILIALSTLLSAVVINLSTPADRPITMPSCFQACGRDRLSRYVHRFQGVLVEDEILSSAPHECHGNHEVSTNNDAPKRNNNAAHEAELTEISKFLPDNSPPGLPRNTRRDLFYTATTPASTPQPTAHTRRRCTIQLHALATLLDRIFFVVFIVGFILAIVLVFPRG